MRQPKFTETQIVSTLKRPLLADRSMRSGSSTASVPARTRSGKPSIEGWKVSDVKRLKELEHENSRLKEMYADL